MAVFGYRVDVSSGEEADHAQKHDDAIAAEVGVSVHGEGPGWQRRYFTKEYLWK